MAIRCRVVVFYNLPNRLLTSITIGKKLVKTSHVTNTCKLLCPNHFLFSVVTYYIDSNFAVYCRRIQLSLCRHRLQKAIQLLPHYHLCSRLHARHCLMGQLLVGSTCRTRKGLSGGHHPANHVHANIFHKQCIAACCLHQGH